MASVDVTVIRIVPKDTKHAVVGHFPSLRKCKYNKKRIA